MIDVMSIIKAITERTLEITWQNLKLSMNQRPKISSKATTKKNETNKKQYSQIFQ